MPREVAGPRTTFCEEKGGGLPYGSGVLVFELDSLWGFERKRGNVSEFSSATTLSTYQMQDLAPPCGEAPRWVNQPQLIQDEVGATQDKSPSKLPALFCQERGRVILLLYKDEACPPVMQSC